MSDISRPEFDNGRVFATVHAMHVDDRLRSVQRAHEDGLLRTLLADWEIARLFHFCLPAVLVDVQLVKSFAEFRAVWLPLVGHDGARWLLPLFMSAAASPAIVVEHRSCLLTSVAPDDLDDDPQWLTDMEAEQGRGEAAS